MRPPKISHCLVIYFFSRATGFVFYFGSFKSNCRALTMKIRSDEMLALQPARQSAFYCVAAVYTLSAVAVDGGSESRGVCICMFLFPFERCSGRKSLKSLV